MKVRDLTLGLGILTMAGVMLTGTSAFAQSPREGGSPGGSSDRGGGGGTAGGNTGGSGGGSSVATSGGGGGSSSSGGGSMGGGGFSSPGISATSSNLSFGDRSVRQTAPSHRSEFAAFSRAANSASNGDAQARPRTGSPDSSGGGGGDRAVPRGGSSGGGSSSGSAVNTRERARPTADNGNNSAGAREVPTWSRPRGDRPVTGVAVDRVGPPPDPDRDNRGRYYGYYGYGGYGGYYNGYYNGFYGCGYGWGCYPYSFGLGYGLYSGIGWNPYVGDPLDPYYSGGYGGYSSGVYNTRESGNLKLKVKPRTAKVYVDGFYIGLVDEFDGAFQKLALNSGRHKVEIRADGYETAEFDVVITPDQTVTFQGDLKRIQ